MNDNLRAQEIKFREECKQELARLQNAIEYVLFHFVKAVLTWNFRQAKHPNRSSADLDKITSEINDKVEKMKIIRLQLAKKNRSIAALQRQLDEVPDRAELAQYQKRFLELYNQGNFNLLIIKRS